MIWRYQEGTVTIPSIQYLQWWAVDRAVELWEFWIGGGHLGHTIDKYLLLSHGGEDTQHGIFGFVRS